MTTIHAEITGDGGSIVLVAGGLGDPESVALAARRLKALTPLFAKSDPPGALLCPLTWSAVVQLSATFGDAWRPGARLAAWIDAQILTRQSVETPLYTPPPGLTPYPWQTAGAALIAATGRVLITDEPGTGKTITTILGLVEWQDSKDREALSAAFGPVVVVAPASVVDPWVEAWGAWAPHVRAIAWRGPKRRELLGTANVYVTSYDTARVDAPTAGTKDMRPLLELEPAALVVDECHLIKSPQAQRSQAVRRIAKRVAAVDGAVVALSGTPITHHPADLWPTLVCLEPGAHPSRERWVNRYCEVIPGDYKDEILGLNRLTEPEFRLSLLGQHRRVAKADVLADLPPKVHSVRTVQLPAKWRKAYDEFESQMLAQLPDESGELSVMDVLTKFNLLTRLASSAADVEISHGPDVDEFTGELKSHIHLNLKAPSWKVDALLEILAERCGANGGEQVVAFAPSAQLVKLAGAAAALAGYRVGYVVGGQSMTERTAAVMNFQAGELDLICVTTGAGGTGITLHAARTCVFLQRPWSLVEALQAEDRLHRIGAVHESIEVIDVVASNTIDTRVRAVLRERAGQLSDLVQDPRIAAELLGGTAPRDVSPAGGLQLATDPERKAS